MLGASNETCSKTSSNPSITFISGNPDKRRDATTILSSKYPLKLVNVDLKELQGTEEEIASEKCFLAMKMFENEIVVIEDTSLRFSQFGGMPGPYIKHFNKAVGAQGLYRMLVSYEDKTAIVRSTVAIGIPRYLSPNNHRIIFTVSNDSKGEIVEPRGNRGDINGWDPCFKPAGSSITLGEMSEDERHRYCSRVGSLIMATNIIQNVLDQNNQSKSKNMKRSNQ